MIDLSAAHAVQKGKAISFVEYQKSHRNDLRFLCTSSSLITPAILSGWHHPSSYPSIHQSIYFSSEAKGEKPNEYNEV